MSNCWPSHRTIIEALFNNGVVLAALGRTAEAIASYDRALTVKPDFVEALNIPRHRFVERSSM